MDKSNNSTVEQNGHEEKKLKIELSLTEEYKDKFLRIKADFDNYRRRMEKEKEELSSYLTAVIFKSLFPVVDDLEKGILK